MVRQPSSFKSMAFTAIAGYLFLAFYVLCQIGFVSSSHLNEPWHWHVLVPATAFCGVWTWAAWIAHFRRLNAGEYQFFRENAVYWFFYLVFFCWIVPATGLFYITAETSISAVSWYFESLDREKTIADGRMDHSPPTVAATLPQAITPKAPLPMIQKNAGLPAPTAPMTRAEPQTAGLPPHGAEPRGREETPTQKAPPVQHSLRIVRIEPATANAASNVKVIGEGFSDPFDMNVTVGGRAAAVADVTSQSFILTVPLIQKGVHRVVVKGSASQAETSHEIEIGGGTVIPMLFAEPDARETQTASRRR